MQQHLSLFNEVNINKFGNPVVVNHGGFSTVYQLKEIEENNVFAAKILNNDHCDEKFKQMIQMEIIILGLIHHPTIIKFFGYSLNDPYNNGHITLIMEYAENGSLADVLKEIKHSTGPKDYTDTNRQIILAGIARGMKYLHDRGIIHRDLKPGNVLLDENFHPLLSDFGLSKFSQSNQSLFQAYPAGTLL